MLLENKVEMMDDRIEKLDKKIQEYEKVIFLSNKMLKFQPFMILICTLISALYGFVFGGLSNVNAFMTYAIYNGLFNGIEGLLWAVLASSVVSIYFGTVKLIYKKSQVEIEVSKKLKEQYEKELLEINEEQFILSSSIVEMKEPVFLMQRNDVIEFQINEEVDTLCKENKSKRLILRKKNR